MSHEYLALASEVKELESILTAIPQENVIERMAFEERLASAKTILEGSVTVRCGIFAPEE